jgi:hypothetical protein
LVVIISEHIPVHDSLEIMAYAKQMDTTVIGPNTPGVISPGVGKLGIMPTHIFDEGNVGEMFLYQVLGGGFLFGAVYMITDPVTSPVTKFGRVFYGLLGGALAAMIRFMGAYPEGVCFSILIVNMLTPCIDYFMKGRRNTYTWQQCVIALSTLAVLSVIVSASVCRGWF